MQIQQEQIQQNENINSHISYSLLKNYFKNNFNFINSSIIFQTPGYETKTYFQFKIRGTNNLYNIEIQEDKTFQEIINYINEDIKDKFPDLILKYS